MSPAEYAIRIPVDGSKRIIVERTETRPATGLRNWLRRRRVERQTAIVGAFVTDQEMVFEMERHLNGPATLNLHIRGQSPDAPLTTRRHT